MLALDILLLLLISVCIAYCWILNQRIRELHNSRAEFAIMIRAFDTAVIKAENCIADLSVLGKNSTLQIKKASETANEVIEELKTVYAIGDKLGTKLENSIMDARTQQKSFEESLARNERFRAQEEYIDEDLANLDLEQKKNFVDNRSGNMDNNTHVPQNILEKVLNKITSSNQKATIDQNAYYNTLKRINLRK